VYVDSSFKKARSSDALGVSFMLSNRHKMHRHQLLFETLDSIVLRADIDDLRLFSAVVRGTRQREIASFAPTILRSRQVAIGGS